MCTNLNSVMLRESSKRTVPLARGPNFLTQL
jgi:hypothetical protein